MRHKCKHHSKAACPVNQYIFKMDSLYNNFKPEVIAVMLADSGLAKTRFIWVELVIIAVVSFLGWNSLLEQGLVDGVPMITFHA